MLALTEFPRGNIAVATVPTQDDGQGQVGLELPIGIDGTAY
jgi:hypothetical protein